MSQLEAYLGLIWGWVGQLEATPTQVNAKMGYLEVNVGMCLSVSCLPIWASSFQFKPQVDPFEPQIDPLSLKFAYQSLK